VLATFLYWKNYLTLILLTWRIWWAPNNASRWQMGFNSAFKGLKTEIEISWEILSTFNVSTCYAKAVSNIELSKYWDFLCIGYVMVLWITSWMGSTILDWEYQSWRTPDVLFTLYSLRRMWISWLANYRIYWENSLFRYLHSTTLTTCGLLTQTFLCITMSLTK